jgi:prepilin-type N-terminal cleavage/methylation domain-containing protein
MKRERRGLALTEVLVVVAILLILATIGLVVGRSVKQAVSKSTCEIHLRSLHSALQLYRNEWGNPTIAVGDVGLLGLPPDWISRKGISAKTPLFGTWEEWQCPAPKSRAIEYMPHYEYLVWPGEEFVEHTRIYKGRTPIILDKNHNDHAKNSAFSPRVPKLIMFIDLDGKFSRKTVHRPFVSGTDLKFFELE